MEKSSEALLLELVREDVGRGDVTSEAVIPKGTGLVAEVIANHEGIAAGVEEACWLFKKPGVSAAPKVKDGARVSGGMRLVELKGDARKIFAVERVALNVIGRMSGIATMAARAVEIAGKEGSHARIAATRKTILGHLDKKAVALGGGWTHRSGLYDMVLIKTDHLALVGSVAKAVETARKKVGGRMKVEVEVHKPVHAVEAASAGADIVMLDNFGHREIDEALAQLGAAGLRKRVQVELSGGITLENLHEFARHDADIISMGCLTHSAPWLDVNLRIRGFKGSP